MKKKIIAFVIVLVVVIMGYNTMINKKNTTDDVEEILVQEYTIIESSIKELLSSSGNVQSTNSIDIISKSTGQIKLNYDIGDKVKSGDLLATIEDDSINLQIITRQNSIRNSEVQLKKLISDGRHSYKISRDNAKLDFEEAKQSYEKDMLLEEAGVISKSELEASKSLLAVKSNAYDISRANYDSFDLEGEIDLISRNINIELENIKKLESDKEKLKVFSSLDGVITEKYVNDKALVNSGTIIYQIMDLDKLEIRAEISEYEIYKVKEGQKVEIKPLGLQGKSYTGEVEMVYPSASVLGEQVYIQVLIRIIETDADLKVGFSCSIDILVNEKEKAFKIPYESIVIGKDGNYIRIKAGNSEKKIKVKTGIESDLFIEVISDELKSGDILIYDTITQKKETKDVPIVKKGFK